MSRKTVSYAVTLGLWVLLAAGAAQANNAYQGSDYSYAYSSNDYLAACDKEADDRAVYARASHQSAYPVRTVYKDTANDPDGSGGTSCGGWSGAFNVSEHWTIERINNWPDAFGDISYH